MHHVPFRKGGRILVITNAYQSVMALVTTAQHRLIKEKRGREMVKDHSKGDKLKKSP